MRIYESLLRCDQDIKIGAWELVPLFQKIEDKEHTNQGHTGPMRACPEANCLDWIDFLIAEEFIR